MTEPEQTITELIARARHESKGTGMMSVIELLCDVLERQQTAILVTEHSFDILREEVLPSKKGK